MVKFNQAVDSFKSAKRLGGRAEKTLEQYDYVLGGLIDYLEGEVEVEKITKDDIRGFLQHLYDKGLSKTTIAIHHRVLSSFFNWLVAEREIQETPLENVPEPTTPKQFPRILSQDQVDQLVESLRERLDCWSGYRNYAMVVTLLDVGLRRQELIDAKIDDLNVEGHTLKVNGKGAKDRMVSFGKETASVLRKWLTMRDSIKSTVQSETIFIGMNGKKLKPRNVGRLVERMQERADLEDTKLSPHVLRHTSATLNVKNGMDAFSLRRQFGWENMETAMKYVHMTGGRLAEKMKDASPIDNLYDGDSHKRNNKRDDQGRWVSG